MLVSLPKRPLVCWAYIFFYLFTHMNKMRRFNTIRHVAPEFSSMVVDLMVFLPEKTAISFEKNLLSELLQEVEMDFKMVKNGLCGSHSSSRKGNYSHIKGDQRGDGPCTIKNSSNNHSKGGANWNGESSNQSNIKEDSKAFTIIRSREGGVIWDAGQMGEREEK